MTFGKPRLYILRAIRLVYAVQWTRLVHQATACAVIPAYAIDGDRIGLGRIDRDMEVNRVTFVHTDGRRVAQDLPVDIVSQWAIRKISLPVRRARLLVFNANGIRRSSRAGLT